MTGIFRYKTALPFIVAMFIVAACSTTKNKWINRQYHNMTSRYNGYFYAKENMKDAMEMLNRTYVDDYSQILPVFRLPNTPETKGCYVALEKAMKKATTVIEHHSITTKGGAEIPGAVKWIDDNYLIIGQARFYKGEYLSSIEIFDYLILKYGQLEIRYDALLWKAKAQIELNGYTEAESILDLIANDKGCPERLTGELKATYAYLYIQTGNYKKAITALEEAIKETKSKKTRTRYTYILGQLYEKMGKEKEAYEAYAAVIDLHPAAYDMQFNAKLSRARLSANDPKNRPIAKKEMLKMLDDIKNDDYQDQIYYTLAQIEMGAKNETAAMSYYQLSINTSVSNNKQKSFSYLALGDIYFNRTDYKNAQAYYDSTMSALPKDYPGYSTIDEKRKSLTTLVRYIDLVAFEDSVQMIAKKYGADTTKLYPFIDKLIEKVKADDKKKQDALNSASTSGNNSSGLNNNNGGAGAWYFYNQGTIAFGATEFLKKWGNRKLEDNWRRANKESVMENDDQNSGSDTSKTKASAFKDKYSRQYYIKDIPLTDSMLLVSDSLIADALFNLGSIYKEQLKNYPRSIDAFNSLCSRYPKHKYALPSHFQLYRIYSDKNIKEQDAAKALEQSSYICNNFPETEYCALIKNPEYGPDMMKGKREISTYYDSTYATYLRRNYQEVIMRCNYADSAFGVKPANNPQVAMFAYLRAVSYGKTQGIPAMEAALTRIIANYPKDPIRPQVQALLDAIHKTSNVKTDSTTTSLYLDHDNVEFQYIVVWETGKGDLNKFKIALSNFNTENFASAGLAVSSIILDDKHQVVTVKKFANQKAANDYYTLLKGHAELFSELTKDSYQAFSISTENFAIFYRDKNVATYKTFFDNSVIK